MGTLIALSARARVCTHLKFEDHRSEFCGEGFRVFTSALVFVGCGVAWGRSQQEYDLEYDIPGTLIFYIVLLVVVFVTVFGANEYEHLLDDKQTCLRSVQMQTCDLSRQPALRQLALARIY